MKLYGSLNNRFEENKQFCKEIEVGTGVTEYLWSDRHAYEVIEVEDQKHITIREYDHKLKGGAYSNDWELISNEKNPALKLVKRGNYWYNVVTATIEDLKRYEKAYENRNDIDIQIWWAHNEFDKEKVLKYGKQNRYHRMNVSIGVADYYYDYEF